MAAADNQTSMAESRAERRAVPKPVRIPLGDRPMVLSDEGMT